MFTDRAGKVRYFVLVYVFGISLARGGRQSRVVGQPPLPHHDHIAEVADIVGEQDAAQITSAVETAPVEVTQYGDDEPTLTSEPHSRQSLTYLRGTAVTKRAPPSFWRVYGFRVISLVAVDILGAPVPAAVLY